MAPGRQGGGMGKKPDWPGSLPLPSRAWQLGQWVCARSLRCLTINGMKLRARLCECCRVLRDLQ